MAPYPLRACVAYLLSFLASQATSICYYPNGDVTPADVPCLPGNDASFCCGDGYACLSNKICMLTNQTPKSSGATTYVRGSCTDASWRSANCPSFCVNPAAPYSDDTAGGEGMAICPNSTGDFYCVDFDTNGVNCAQGKGLAVQGTVAPSILTTINFVSSTTSSTSISKTTSTTTSKGALSTTSTRTPSVFVTPSSSSSKSSNGAIAGGVVGGVAGVLIIIGAIYFLYRRSGKRKATELDSNQTSWFNTSRPPQYESGEGIAMKYQTPLHEAYVPPSELDGRNTSELSANSPMIQSGAERGW